VRRSRCVEMWSSRLYETAEAAEMGEPAVQFILRALEQLDICRFCQNIG
jgi:hypothetical protein